MFKRPQHQCLSDLLSAFDGDQLQESDCYLGGGAATVLLLGEYRDCSGIDFLCASTNGYKRLRNIVSDDLGPLLKEPIQHLRSLQFDQHRIYTVLEVGGRPVKVQFVLEDRISISGQADQDFGVPTLCREDLYCQKLLANADRGMDRHTMSKDAVDLAIMIESWGHVPASAWLKAHSAYGDHLIRQFHKSTAAVSERNYLADCLDKMQMAPQLVESIPSALAGESELGTTWGALLRAGR